VNLLIPPHGERAIVEFYGWNAATFLQDATPSVAWEREMMVRVDLPQPMRFGGAPVKTITVHTKLAGVFTGVYEQIFRAGLWSVVEPFSGAYCFRLIRGGESLSMHAFGAAVDHDSARNPLGAATSDCRFGNTPEGRDVVKIFERNGFMWGGRFQNRKDGMHFQYGSGY
jgi:hypothetical protein